MGLNIFDLGRRGVSTNGLLTARRGPSFEVFATMCIHRHVDPEAFSSVISLLHCPDPKFTFSRRRGDALIDRARSLEATRFLLKSKAEVLFFMDDDILFDPLDAVKVCKEAREKEAIVGAAYVLKKRGGGQFNIKCLSDKKVLVFGKGGGLHEVRYVSTGFMAIHRSVLEEVAKTLPRCVFPDEEDFYPFFQPYAVGIEGRNIYLSEDWAMCQRAADCGFKTYCDTTVKLGHAGRTVYNWDNFEEAPLKKVDSLTYTERIEG